jgi:VCBS repeat-containing protein
MHLGVRGMANPVVNFIDTTFVFKELANTFDSPFLHDDTLFGTIDDDNNPDYDVTFAYIPDPAKLPGSIFVEIEGTFSTPPPDYEGTIFVDYEVEDSRIDFLRQGVKVTQEIDVTITDLDTGEATTVTFTIEITGANDTPTGRADKRTVSEQVASVVSRVLNNDTDPDVGDALALTTAGFKVKSITSTGEKFLTKAMIAVSQINALNPGNALALKDAIKIELDQAFEGLAKGETATIVIEYGISDDFGGLSASTYTLTVKGANDRDIVGSKANDRFLFGEKDGDRIFGLEGNDVIDARGGNDIIFGGPGADRQKGGKGIDTASYELSKQGVKANLLNSKSNTGDAKGDTYNGIENLTGTNKPDVLTGNKAGNHIKGLFGSDTLNGGDGNDILEGGLGADIHQGGRGKDTILFASAQDSLTFDKKLVDTVNGFSRKQGDTFDLRGVDPNSKTKKNEAFKFIDTKAFSGAAGELRLEKTKKQTVVQGDTNGDGFADFGFVVVTPVKLVEGDFLL